MRCEKCGKEIKEKWERHKTYKGHEGHHHPPLFMMEMWQGDILDLCVDCHDEMHQEIIKILNKNSNLLKFCNSEHWTWKKMTGEQRTNSLEEVIEFKNEWLKNGDTETITAA